MDWSVIKLTEFNYKTIIKDLAPRLRSSDILECRLSTGKDPEEVLLESFSYPKLGMWVGCYKGIPEVIGGVTTWEHDDTVGFPWMMCTDVTTKHPKGFLRLSRKWVEGISNIYRVLINFVHDENTTHKRWIKWAGFEFIKLHEQYGHEQEPFWEFRMERKT